MNIRDFALLALFIALVAVATMIIRIPIPQTNGYMNLGDSIVLLSGVFFGPVAAFMAGGMGSALADIIGGYPQWAPWTLIIKGMEALIVWLGFFVFKTKKNKIGIVQVLCFCVATAWMVLGYLVAEWIMYDKMAAMAELPFNLIQAAGSVILASLLLPVFNRVIQKRRT
ncbi:MAG: ECF transporter S component [Thermodesulfobacteriota bacterium]|nr:ECF transporter S component [Thermodesulfobacteriota bacterium]